MLRVLVDVIDEAQLLLVERSFELFFEQFGEADDGVQRRAQFMAHTAEELAFEPVGAFHSSLRISSSRFFGREFRRVRELNGFQLLLCFLPFTTSRMMAETHGPSSNCTGLKLISTGKREPSFCWPWRLRPVPMGRRDGLAQ